MTATEETPRGELIGRRIVAVTAADVDRGRLPLPEELQG